MALAQYLDRLDQRTRVEGVTNGDHVAEQAGVLAAGGLLPDAEQPHVTQPGDRAREAQGGLEGERCDEDDVHHSGILGA